MKKQAIWPGWETTRLIGRGSFGAVYEIERRLFEDDEPEKAALKVITIPQSDSDIEELYNDGYDEESVTSTFRSHLKSIVAEYSLMRKMNGSSNIVNCDDVRYVQHDDGIGWDIYIKMELLTPLTKALPATVSEEQVIRIAKDMCEALELCSKHNIIHRDIKPQNIFVSENGDYKLGDFGIAKTVEKTMGGTKAGTYKYMAPEVYSNKPYNSTADIYSLGLVLYWMLNERRMPFMPLPPEKLKAGMDEESRSRRFLGEKIPVPKNGSKELKRIVLKACAFDSKERYQSAREMREDLVRISGGQAVEFIPDPKPAPIFDVQNDTDDNETVGPIFEHTPVVDTDSLDKTVGPIFDHNGADDLDKGNAIESNTTSKKKKGKKAFGLMAALLSVGILCGFLFWGEGTSTDADKDASPTLGEQTIPSIEDNNQLPLINSPIDISGSFALGSHFVSYDPISVYTFEMILDQNHRLYLRNSSTDDPFNNIVYDTGISNVASVCVGYEYDSAYGCNIPKLYYLTTAKEIWTAKMIPGEKWAIQQPERYGEWSDVRQIYFDSSILPGFVILQENGDLYVGTQKIPVPNVVKVQCLFDSIMFRTADGTFYVAGNNSYGSFVETSADSIPFEQPKRLLIPADIDDACVVRAVINGQQNNRVAILNRGTLSIQDKPGNYLVEGFADVRAIQAADMGLHIIHEDGTLYGFGSFEGAELTAAGSTENHICRITELDDMNKIMGLALHGWGCMAVDCDGVVRIHTTSYTGPLYKENGEQFAFNEISKPEETLKVAVSPDYVPMCFVDSTKTRQDRYVGFDISMAKYIADYLNRELIIMPMDFDDCDEAVSNGVVDLAIASYGWNEDRESSYNLSDYYYPAENENTQVLITLSSNGNKFATAESLAGAKIGVQNASRQQSAAETQLIDSELIAFVDLGTAVQNLKSGEFDCVAVSAETGDAIIAKNPDIARSGFVFCTDPKKQAMLFCCRRVQTI